MSIFDRYENYVGPSLDRSDDIDYEHVKEEDTGQEIENPKTRVFSLTHAIIGGVIVVILILQLFQTQIVQGGQNAHLAKEHSIRQIIKPAPRGVILDKRGVWLARNTTSFQVQLVPADLPINQNERNDVINKIAEILGWDKIQQDQLSKTITKLSYQIDPVVIKDNLDHDQALILTEKLNDVSAVSVVPQQVRQYNQPENGLSHILGYVGFPSDQEAIDNNLRGNDVIGKVGIESSYDHDLRGSDGIVQSVVDSKGKVLSTLSDHSQDAVPGNNLVLHIDLKLQNIMATELKNGLDKAGLASGVAIAMDPRDGSVLGIVSLPAYDNNKFSGGVSSQVYSSLVNDPNKPLFNRSLSGTYPSGSTIKPFVAAIGLQEGVIKENTKIDTPPEITVGQWKFPNWQHIFISGVDVKQAIAKSNDVFFYAVGGGWDKIKGLGIDKLSKGLGLFGFGQKTGIDLPNESTGIVPNSAWKQQQKNESWYIGDTYHLAIGQGDFLATPLQLVTALSAVANGGTLYEPRIVDREVDYKGNLVETINPKVVRDHFISNDNIQIVREGMKQTVTDGSGRILQDLPVSSGAKTGTAQVGANNENLHAWFEAFAPYDNPTIAIVVLGEKGPQTNEGNTTAAPIANAVLQQYFSPDFSK